VVVYEAGLEASLSRSPLCIWCAVALVDGFVLRCRLPLRPSCLCAFGLSRRRAFQTASAIRIRHSDLINEVADLGFGLHSAPVAVAENVAFDADRQKRPVPLVSPFWACRSSKRAKEANARLEWVEVELVAGGNLFGRGFASRRSVMLPTVVDSERIPEGSELNVRDG